MRVTATELKSNIGKYLRLAQESDIYITRNGKEVAKLSKPTHDRIAALNTFSGIAESDVKIDEKEMREERLKRQ